MLECEYYSDTIFFVFHPEIIKKEVRRVASLHLSVGPVILFLLGINSWIYVAHGSLSLFLLKLDR